MNARLGLAARTIRQKHGLELLDIAQVAGVAESTLSRFERGHRWPERLNDIVAAYAEATGTTPREIWRQALESTEDA